VLSPPTPPPPPPPSYYSAVSWTDYLIGQILDALESSGVANDTVVALIGDHGWQLG
jgi:iduronate 2-sulfatase